MWSIEMNEEFEKWFDNLKDRTKRLFCYEIGEMIYAAAWNHQQEKIDKLEQEVKDLSKRNKLYKGIINLPKEVKR